MPNCTERSPTFDIDLRGSPNTVMSAQVIESRSQPPDTGPGDLVIRCRRGQADEALPRQRQLAQRFAARCGQRRRNLHAVAAGVAQGPAVARFVLGKAQQRMRLQFFRRGRRAVPAQILRAGQDVERT